MFSSNSNSFFYIIIKLCERIKSLKKLHINKKTHKPKHLLTNIEAFKEMKLFKNNKSFNIYAILKFLKQI